VPEELPARVMDVALILHAEHSMNASTFTARVVGSTLTDPYAVVASAVGALAGRLHGGANERVLEVLRAIPDLHAQRRAHVRRRSPGPQGPDHGLRAPRVQREGPARGHPAGPRHAPLQPSTAARPSTTWRVELEKQMADLVGPQGCLPERRLLQRHRLREARHPGGPVHAGVRDLARGRLARAPARAARGQPHLPSRRRSGWATWTCRSSRSASAERCGQRYCDDGPERRQGIRECRPGGGAAGVPRAAAAKLSRVPGARARRRCTGCEALVPGASRTCPCWWRTRWPTWPSTARRMISALAELAECSPTDAGHGGALGASARGHHAAPVRRRLHAARGARVQRRAWPPTDEGFLAFVNTCQRRHTPLSRLADSCTGGRSGRTVEVGCGAGSESLALAGGEGGRPGPHGPLAAGGAAGAGPRVGRGEASWWGR
jgi:hypothetical protein